VTERLRRFLSVETPRSKLTPSEIASLGGLRSAELLTPEQRQARARSGGAATLDQYGRSHFKKLALKRHGRIETLDKKAKKAKAATAPLTGAAAVKGTVDATTSPN
jgi:hypothetical protein